MNISINREYTFYNVFSIQYHSFQNYLLFSYRRVPNIQLTSFKICDYMRFIQQKFRKKYLHIKQYHKSVFLGSFVHTYLMG